MGAEEPELREVTAKELQKKIASMEAKMDELKAKQQEVAAHPDKQVSTTDRAQLDTMGKQAKRILDAVP